MKPENLRGIMPALMTAFTDDGESIDTVRIRALTSHLMRQGVHGLYVGGSSGEMVLCSAYEREKLLETVIDETQGKLTVIAHIGSALMRETLELSRHAANAGADALSSVTPFYFGYSFNEVKYFYQSIADTSELPVIIYNIPARTGMSLNIDQLHELLEIPGVGGMKFTCSDFFQLERLCSAHPDKVFFNGSDEMLLSGLSAGADGGIGTTYNFQADRMLEIYRLYHSGDMKAALNAQSKANAIISEVLKYGVLTACKEMLDIGGLDYGKCRPPFISLTADERKALEAAAFENLGKGFMLD